MSNQAYFDVLRAARDEYWRNAERAIESREYRKASELLWGAVAQEIKILAATHNTVINSHREFAYFVRQIASEQRDESLYRDFIEINALHRNFYDEVIPIDVFPDYYQKFLRFMDRLDQLVRAAAV